MIRLLPPSADALDDARSLAISDGEANCILGFIHDGSIAAEPWHRLMGGWGCAPRLTGSRAYQRRRMGEDR
jgi:hypothetical protein